jgi:large subunit ribosomal protein L14
MLGLLSKIKIIDNSGIIYGRCIKIVKPNKLDEATIGDIILISILKTWTHSKFKKGNLAKVLITRTKFNNFGDNAGIILNEKRLPIGSRVRGPLPFRLNRNVKLSTITGLSTIV